MNRTGEGLDEAWTVDSMVIIRSSEHTSSSASAAATAPLIDWLGIALIDDLVQKAYGVVW
jgi:hypothetical protein